MAEDDGKILTPQTEQNEAAQTAEQPIEQSVASPSDAKEKSAKKEKGGKEKKAKGKKDETAADENVADAPETKNGKKGKFDLAKAQKEWEESIVSSKRVKRELARKKATRILALVLILSLLLTSIIYVMLLFVDQNNIIIKAHSSEERTIALSSDSSVWTPNLNVDGPEEIWNISYNPDYIASKISEQTPPTYEDMFNMVQPGNTDGVLEGRINGDNDKFIAFSFMLKNTSAASQGNISFKLDMTVNASKQETPFNSRLVDSVRIMWIESYGSIADHVADEDHSGVYATRTNNSSVVNAQKLNETAGQRRTMLTDAMGREYWVDEYGNIVVDVDGYALEKWAYPPNLAIDNTKSFNQAYLKSALSAQDILNGYRDTKAFYEASSVFNYESYIVPDEIIRYVVVVWLEGSDFDCEDTARTSSVSFAINFEVI